MSIAKNLAALRAQVPEGVQIVAVSKFHPVEALREAYDAGQRVFGENRVQELLVKAGQMPDDVQWHMIGHLQTNKVRALVPRVTMIESVDSLRLLQLIGREACSVRKEVDVLLQLHVAQEETKTGFTVEELLATLVTGEIEAVKGVRIRGLMAMASNTDDAAQVEREFQTVADTFTTIREEFYPDTEVFNVLSMGMSHDWPLAVRHGATHIRVGSSIFGDREY